MLRVAQAVEAATAAADVRHREIMNFLGCYDDNPGTLNGYVRNIVTAINVAASAAANPGG